MELEVKKIVKQKGSKWTAIVLVGSEVLYSVETNNKISASSTAGKWIKQNKNTIDEKINQIKQEQKLAKERELSLLQGMGRQKYILMHQMGKISETVPLKDTGHTIVYINSTYTPALGHIRIAGSSYPLDYNPINKTWFVGIKVTNIGTNSNLFSDHRKYVEKFIEHLINLGENFKNNFQSEYFPILKTPFSNNYIYLVNYLTMTILCKLHK